MTMRESMRVRRVFDKGRLVRDAVSGIVRRAVVLGGGVRLVVVVLHWWGVRLGSAGLRGGASACGGCLLLGGGGGGGGGRKASGCRWLLSGRETFDIFVSKERAVSKACLRCVRVVEAL